MSAIHARRIAPTLLAAATFSLAACGGHGNNTQPADNTPNVTPATTTAPAPGTAATTQPMADTATTAKHHSKLAGAALGAAAGHVVGGRRGMVAGAIIGAEVQHHRNKVAQEHATHP